MQEGDACASEDVLCRPQQTHRCGKGAAGRRGTFGSAWAKSGECGQQPEFTPKAGNDLGALTEVVNNWHHTCISAAPAEVLPVLQEARNSMIQRGRQEDRSLNGTWTYHDIPTFSPMCLILAFESSCLLWSRRLYPTAGDFCAFRYNVPS